MDKKLFFPESRLTGMLLILSSVIFLVAAIFFTIRFILEMPVCTIHGCIILLRSSSELRSCESKSQEIRYNLALWRR